MVVLSQPLTIAELTEQAWKQSSQAWHLCLRILRGLPGLENLLEWRREGHRPRLFFMREDFVQKIEWIGILG